MSGPVRIQLSRRKGFNLQAASLAANGLPAVRVCRPTKWGNPFSVEEYGRDRAVRNFRQRIAGLLEIDGMDLSPLRGKNLACWCKPDEACHADVLIELANQPAERPFWARCEACGHCWAIAYLPMEISVAAKLMLAARCPKGCDGRVLVAKQSNGVLHEPDAARCTIQSNDGGEHVTGA